MQIPDTIRNLVAAIRSFRFRRPETLDASVFAAVCIAVLVGLGLLVWLVKGSSLIVNNNRRSNLEAARGPLSGLPCPDPTLRPVAVMLASDPQARPLSGLHAADIVFEVSVTPTGITRMMAVFQCMEPDEVGSVRSARSAFIPLVQGLQAIYAHWGGERDALASLEAGVTDNIDAMKYEGTVYYRKSAVPRPHNGFTTLEALREKADELGYLATASLSPYAHASDVRSIRNLGSITDIVTLPGPPEMEVEFRYDVETSTYQRWRGGEPEIDALNDIQVAPSVVIVMKTEVERTYDQYLDLVTIGEGTATVYQGGRSISARWHKRSANKSLRFTDTDGRAIAFAHGQIWVIIRPIQ